MRTAFPWLTVEVTNDSVFFKQAKVVHLVPLCIWFAFYSTLLFSSQGNFCVFYLLRLSGLHSRKAQRRFHRVKILRFSVFTLEALQSRAICQSLPSLLFESFSSKDKEKSILSFPFQKCRALLHVIPQNLSFFSKITHKLLFIVCNDLIWMSITSKSFYSLGKQWNIHACKNLQEWWLAINHGKGK